MAFSKPKAHERAERYAAKGQHDKAAREYQTIVENDPKDVRAWLMWADCLVRCDDKPGAIERYVRVAQYYVEAKEHNKALAVYRQVLNLDPQRLDIQIKVAQLNLQVGHTQDAISIYERVAHAQLQAGRVADALATYKLVADADPTAVQRRLRLAELYSREKRTADAVEAFRAAGQQLRQLGRPEDYVRVAERQLYHDDSDLSTVRDLARVYLELGDPRRALVKLNGLLRNNPKDEEGIELLAETFMLLGKPEKAISALEELARGLRAKGPEGHDTAIRILRRGLEWRPGHAEFREALTELEARRRPAKEKPGAAVEVVAAPEPEPEPDDEMDVEEFDDDDLVELDEDDLVEEVADEEIDELGAADQVVPRGPPNPVVELPGAASSAPGVRRTVEVEAMPSTEPSLTQSVLSEVEADVVMPDTEGLTDFDKILFEAKVYIKYRLFEHALDHVESALKQQPSHVGAMTLKAQTLTELGRTADAVEAHLAVTELVMPGDPTLGREHLERARGLDPNHPRVVALGRIMVASAPQPTATLRPATPGRPAPEQDGDSGAFDLVAGFDDEGAPPGVALDLADEPKANLVSAHDEFDPSTKPFTPIDLDEDEPVPVQSGPAIEVPMDEDEVTPIPSRAPVNEAPAQAGSTLVHYPPQDRPPRPIGTTPKSADDFNGELELELEPAPRRAADGSPTQAISVDPDITDAVELDLPPEPEPEPELEPELELELEPEPEPEPEPESSQDWPDLSDELDEIRFYVDQGLDDDAEAALDDLEGQYPGHPQIAKFRGKAPAAAPPKPAPKPVPKPIPKLAPKPVPKPAPEPELMPEPEPASSLPQAFDDEDVEALVALEEEDDAAAAPLVSFDDEDEDDDYLSAIFADPVEPKAKAHTEGSTRGANLVEGQSVDAATAFDLGVAYREMGLVDQAITQFESAAGDPQWRARALTLLGALRLHRGETDQAINDLKEAVQLASTPSETSEAAYELGVLYEVIGDTEAAIQQLMSVAPGYRDRDERLASLGF